MSLRVTSLLAATCLLGVRTHAQAPAPEDPPAVALANDPEALALLPTASPFGRFDLYGFADFTFIQPVLERSNAWRFYLPDKATFWVGNMNVYFASQIAQELRSLLEVRFTYLPHGKNRSGVELPGQPYVDNSATDYADVERPIKLGAIEIERVQLEYAPRSWLKLTVGQWLTPYGIWNVDHGSPTTVMTHRPYVVGDQLIPERQTGVLVESEVRVGAHRLGGGIGISNGRGPLDAYYDMDKNKAFTFRAFWNPDGSFGQATLGASGYVGRFTDAQRSVTLVSGEGGKPQLEPREQVNVQYDEYAAGGDMQWTLGSVRIFSEFLINVRKYTERGRPIAGGLRSLVHPSGDVRLEPDSRRYGSYLIGGYRFTWLGIMPFVQLEANHLDDAVLPWALGVIGGVNVRPHSAVTLKLHFGWGWFPDADPDGPGRDVSRALESQVAWAF